MKLRVGEVVIETNNIEMITKETDHTVTVEFVSASLLQVVYGIQPSKNTPLYPPTPAISGGQGAGVREETLSSHWILAFAKTPNAICIPNRTGAECTAIGN